MASGQMSMMDCFAKNGLYVTKKTTGATSATVKFTNTDNRYVGLLLITDNNAMQAIYGVGCKIGTSSFADKIAGASKTITVDQSTGNISVGLGTWAIATLISVIPFT